MKKAHSITIWIILGILTIGYILILLNGLNVFSVQCLNSKFSLNANFDESSALGDTIGGILGPLIAIIASLLTYWALMEQVKANKKQAKQFKKQFSDLKKGAFENRFFLLMDICNTKRKEMNSSDMYNDFFDYALRYFQFHKQIYFATLYKGISNSQKKNRIFGNVNLKESYQIFHNLNYDLAYPMIFGLNKTNSNNYNIDFKKDYFDALNETKPETKIGNMSMSRVFKPEGSVREIEILLNEGLNFGGGIYRNMFPYLESLRLLLSYIYSSYSNKTIDSNDMDFFCSILNNEISENEVIFLFIFQLMMEKEQTFFDTRAIELSKIFHKIEMNKLRDVFSNLVPFSSIEEYYANR